MSCAKFEFSQLKKKKKITIELLNQEKEVKLSMHKFDVYIKH